MPKFKKHTFKILEKKFEIWVNVDAKGKFAFSLPHHVAQALGVNNVDFVFNDAEKAGHELWYWMNQFKELSTSHTYHIKVRFAFSGHLMSLIPNDILPNSREALKKVKRIGSEYFPDDSLTMVLIWKPLVRTIHGKDVSEQYLKPAEEDDIQRAEDEEKEHPERIGFWEDMLHKPYDGIILIEDGKIWDFNDTHFFEVPLTKETYEFFTMFEENYVKMVSQLFQFFDKDTPELLASITKSMLNSGTGLKLLN